MLHRLESTRTRQSSIHQLPTWSIVREMPAARSKVFLTTKTLRCKVDQLHRV